MGLILATDLTSRLTRLNAELTRRNGYNNLSGYVQSFPVNEPVAVNNLAKVSAINTIFTGLRYINGTNVPANRTALTSPMLLSDLTTIDNLLTAFEATPRDNLTTNDCASACSGTCISQCTTTCYTTCSGCKGSCTGDCSSCTGGCYKSCGTNCQRLCGVGCSNTCTGGCNTTCFGWCKGKTNQEAY